MISTAVRAARGWPRRFVSDPRLVVIVGIAALLAVEALIGRNAPRYQLQLVGFTAVAVAAILTAWQPWAGLMLLLTLQVPLWVLRLPTVLFAVQGRGIETNHVIAGLLIGIWVLNLLLGRARIIRSDLNWPALALAMAASIALLASYPAWDPAVSTAHRKLLIQLTELGLTLFNVALALICVSSLNSLKRVRAVFAVIVVVGFAKLIWEISLLRLPPFLAGEGWGRVIMNVVPPSFMMALAYTQFLYAENPRKRLAWLLGLLFLLLAVLGTRSIPNMVDALAAVLFISLVKARRHLPLIILVVSISIFAGAWDKLILYEQQTSIPYRLRLAEFGWQLFFASPVLGVGPGNYVPYADAILPLGWSARSVGLSRPHNDLMYWLVTTGIVGALAFAWLYLALFRTGFRLLREVQDDSSKAMVLGIMAGWFGALFSMGGGQHALLITELLSSFVTSMYYWVLLGLLMAREHLQRQDAQSRVPSPGGALLQS